jgi:hypothetical protein
MYAWLNHKGGVGRMRINTTTWKLFAHAYSDGVGALVFGLCLVLTIKHFDSLYITITVLFGVALIADLFWMRREIRRLAASETARKHATQFLWSYIFFIMISLVFGMAHLSQKNSDADFMSRFGVRIWSAITGAVIYLVVRDAKRLGDAVGSSQITSPRGNK